MTDTSTLTDWAPARGSVARKSWPLPARWAWWLIHRPALVLLVAIAVSGGGQLGPVILVVLAAFVTAGLMTWWRAQPGSFHPTAGRVLLGLWRSFWAYGIRWRAAMMLSGLGGRFDGDEYVPRVVRVRAGRYADRVTVRMVVGQHPADWARRLDALAHAFGARSCQVRELRRRPGYVQLVVGRRDPLAAVIPALDVTEPTDLEAVPLGRREDGAPWTVRLRGSHILVAGATGAGKGSVLWSLIRALGPALRDGLAELWVLDPKGGMELAPGAPLFARFAYDNPGRMVDVLEAAVTVMQARAARLRGVTRLHEPTADEPLIVVIVDELASLTAYVERDDRRRIGAALSLLLSQGRAVGVVVVAALQDPARKSCRSGICSRPASPWRSSRRSRPTSYSGAVPGSGARTAPASRSPLPASAGCGATVRTSPPGSGPRGSPTRTSRPPSPSTARASGSTTARWSLT
jgi:S-DNA-T family DNA segregation ATPase FtsK/SpoIIIE